MKPTETVGRAAKVIQMPERPREERSLGELFSDLSRETVTLARKELELASSEMSGQFSKASRGAGYVSAGTVLVHMGLLFILGAVAAGLSLVLPLWASALIVGTVAAAVGLVLMAKGRKQIRKADLIPRRTLKAIREDSEWLREQMK